MGVKKRVPPLWWENGGKGSRKCLGKGVIKKRA